VQADEQQPGGSLATLGDVLYRDNPKPLVTESDWVSLVQRIAAGDRLALHALYERAHCVVFTLMVRLARNRETAEELTLDVFHDVWRHAARYDPEKSTVLGWLMNQARRQAIERLRLENRDAVHPESDAAGVVQFNEKSKKLRAAVMVLTPEERAAIEAAYFSRMTPAEVALRLKAPLATIKTRIRSGLHKLLPPVTAKASS
jgi:RNA polymerase sigma-70 factor, ECF subfamily